MKIRNGFVSNSSSSSFIVVFPEGPPVSSDEMERILFKDRGLDYPYADSYHSLDGISTKRVAEVVFQDMVENGPTTLKKVRDTCRYGTVVSNDSDSPNRDYNKRCRTYDLRYYKAMEEWSERKAKELIEVVAGGDIKNCFIFKYGDEDGTLGSVMEHSNIFSNVPNVRISNH